MTITIRSLRTRGGRTIYRGYFPSGQEFIRGGAPDEMERWIKVNRPGWRVVVK